MRDEVFARGMAELAASFPSQDETPERKAVRLTVYAEELASLTDDQFRYAVREAIRTCEWFPTVSRLLEYGFAAPPPVSARALMAPQCETCRGTGFELVERDGRTWATPCACRQVASVAQG